MAFTALAAKVYKDPIHVQWANSIKNNFDEIHDFQSIHAWVAFNSVTSTLYIQASYNVSSIVKTGTGLFLVSWNNDFPTSTYAVFGTHCDGLTNTANIDSNMIGIYSKTCGTVNVIANDDSNVKRDGESISIGAIGSFA